MELFAILGRIAIDNSEANKNLTETSENAQKTAGDIGDMTDSGEQSGGKLQTAFSKVGAGVVKFGKAVVAGMAVAGTAIAGLVTKGVQAYAEYEQLVGGVDTLFKESSAKVQEYAKNAYKTAGLSANDYMSTVTSFSGSLLQSLGNDTKKAAEYADMAITDMSDNANKMGTDMGMLQNAYQGFSKQNYMMLDNLKLGYGGTKAEMERLLADAEKLSGQEFDISSYADVVEAIHIIQEEMGITGTTAKEASETITGSLSAMKGSWENLLVAMTSDELPFADYVNAFVDSAENVLKNLLPRIQIALVGVVSLINELAPIIINKLPDIFAELLPAIITAATGLLTAFVNQFPALVGVVMDVLPALIDGVVQIVNGIVEALPQVIQVLIGAFPTLIPQLVAGLVGMVVMLCQFLPDIILPIIDFLPEIITIITSVLMENLPALINGCILLVAGLVAALPKILKALAVALPAALKGIWEGSKKAFSGVGDFFSKTFGEAKTKIVTKCTEIVSSVQSKFNSIKEKMQNPIIKARDKIKSIVNTIKGFFSGMKLSFPKVKLPHFKVSPSGWKVGDLLKGSIPKLSIQWYQKAMKAPMLMNSPTIFGYDPATSTLKAGGEAGSEITGGTATIMRMISDAVAGQNEAVEYYLQKMIQILADYLPQVVDGMDRPIYFDADAMAGSLAMPMDKYLGRIKERKDRGR